MKRREMLKSASMIAASSFFGVNSMALGENLNFYANIEKTPVKRFGDGRDWFLDNNYGLFIHWGLYSIPAWHEQYQQRANIPRSEYVKLSNQFNPVKFNPDQWLDLMQEAGMTYLTITTKHHDGFCLWDTKYTDYNIMNTPYKKDIIGMLAEACHKREIPLCLYYSVVDWHHPNYPNQGRHHELPPQPQDSPDWEKYMEYVKLQVKELCTNYGEIHGFWWDMNVPEYYDPSLNEMIRGLQPKAVINNRGFDEGDFGTPEREFDKNALSASGLNKLTEACQSVGMESWGFRKDEDYYTHKYLMKSLDSFLSRGANYLLNVGPDSSGVIPDVSANVLRKIAKWYFSIKESYDGTEPASSLIQNKNVMLTKKGKVLYVHLNKEQLGNRVKLKPLDRLPVKAKILNDGSSVECVVNRAPSDNKPYLKLVDLPEEMILNTVPVIKLEFDTDLFENTAK